MNEFALDLLAMLLRTTIFLSGAAIAIGLLLKFGRPASPVVHRTAWLLVLLTGWFWWRLPVAIPYVETAAARVSSAVPWWRSNLATSTTSKRIRQCPAGKSYRQILRSWGNYRQTGAWLRQSGQIGHW